MHFSLQLCKAECQKAYNDQDTAKGCNVYFSNGTICYLGNQRSNNGTYKLNRKKVLVTVIGWSLLLRQQAQNGSGSGSGSGSEVLFKKREWTSSAAGKFSIINTVENFRRVQSPDSIKKIPALRWILDQSK